MGKEKVNQPIIHKIFPFLSWLKGYQLSFLRGDALAGFTVAVVLIPQSMAYAMLAGLPPIYGLYAATLAPLIGVHVGEFAPAGDRADCDYEPFGANHFEPHCRAWERRVYRVGCLAVFDGRNHLSGYRAGKNG